MAGQATPAVWDGTWVTERLGIELSDSPGLRDLVGMAIRHGNRARAQLLVSRVLGKHVPQHPSVVLSAGRRLGAEVRALLGAEPAVVLGYAETATALGQCVADELGAVHLHSTRRRVPGYTSVADFEEEHSHATSHLLLPRDPELLAAEGALVLVDDELSTGRTVLNTIAALHRRWPRRRYVLAALVDLRTRRDRARLAEFAAGLGASVTAVALARGEIRMPADVVARAADLVARADSGPARTDVAVRAAAVAERRAPAGVAAEARALAGSADECRAPSGVAAEARALAGSADECRALAGAPVAGACAELVRLELDWPLGVPEGARHGCTPEEVRRLTAALPALAEALAGRLRGDERRVLVLGSEELMYAPLRLAEALAQARPGVEVRFSSTTRSPVHAVDEDGYPIRTAVSFPAPEGEGVRYAYNVAPGRRPEHRFDAVVLVVDATADTPALRAPDGLPARLGATTDRVLLVVLPAVGALPRPIGGPAFSSYPASEVRWLLTDLSGVALEAPTAEREAATQSGRAHYAESLPVEYQPGPHYRELFEQALAASARRLAVAVGVVAETLLRERGSGLVLASLARAGTPVGLLVRRWLADTRGLTVPHYAVSILRGRGIDRVALRYLAHHHEPRQVAFVDGWTGKGAITRELTTALAGTPFDPALAVLADPGRCVRTYGTREDFLIPSACLNSTVSGLVSRTVLRGELIGPGDFHGAKHYRELAPQDVSTRFVDAISDWFSTVRQEALAAADSLARAGDGREPDWAGWAAVERISEQYGLGDVNLVKPGVGETTRVLLRRVPWRVLVRAGAGTELAHVRLLAAERGVPVEEVAELPYSCVGLIRPLGH
ncbi:phosphoribosyltransferase [Kitasatospora sp. RB6PN24]|uniref:phosphoribosyltransferase n=1 Tax=Kitasatospora humi TaxID=2893891 RepID=UPI001E4A2F94|nr:phosphoribosyltransferase [Kitasatospora humi]MCC9310044.1 phosphoribosyltransferase [Kitasatospora humi]